MPPIAINWIIRGVINHCESIGTNFKVFTFVVSPFRRHLMMTSENLEKTTNFSKHKNLYIKLPPVPPPLPLVALSITFL